MSSGALRIIEKDAPDVQSTGADNEQPTSVTASGDPHTKDVLPCSTVPLPIVLSMTCRQRAPVTGRKGEDHLEKEQRRLGDKDGSKGSTRHLRGVADGETVILLHPFSLQ